MRYEPDDVQKRWLNMHRHHIPQIIFYMHVEHMHTLFAARLFKWGFPAFEAQRVHTFSVFLCAGIWYPIDEYSLNGHCIKKISINIQIPLVDAILVRYHDVSKLDAQIIWTLENPFKHAILIEFCATKFWWNIWGCISGSLTLNERVNASKFVVFVRFNIIFAIIRYS